MRRYSWMTLAVLASLAVGCGDPESSDAGPRRDGGGPPPMTDSGPRADAGVWVPPVAEPCPDPVPGSTTTYYVCNCGDGSDSDCQPGDDANPGTAPESPWQTYEAARTGFSNLAPGEMIAFCRGGAFTADGSTRWVNGSCTAGSPCVVRDYDAAWGSGDESAPIIAAVADGNGFSLEDAADADHEEGYTFLNLDLRGAGSGRGFFFYNDIDDVLMCGLSIDGFSLGVHLAGSNDPAAGSDGRNDRVVLRSSRIINNGAQGWLGSGHDSGIEYCYFENNGFEEAIFNHNIYFSSPQGEARNVWAVGNELYRSAIVDGECAGVSLVVHGEKDGLVIENNLVREDVGAAGGGCWGIAVDTGYGSGESFRNVTIRGNTVVNVGNVGIGVNSCESCMIENNVVIHEQARGATGIAAPDRMRDAEDLVMSAITIRNNSILFGPDARGRGVVLGEEGTGHVVVSNAIQYLGDDNNWTCLHLDLPGSAYTVVDYNACHAPLSGGAWGGGEDLSEWQSSSGFDASSWSDDPGFSSLTAPHDLSAAGAASPLVGAGHPSESSPTAHGGSDRDGMPDIGAYEL